MHAAKDRAVDLRTWGDFFLGGNVWTQPTSFPFGVARSPYSYVRFTPQKLTRLPPISPEMAATANATLRN